MTSLYASTASCFLIKFALLYAKIHEMCRIKNITSSHKLRETASFRLNANEEKSARRNLFEMKKLIFDLYRGQIFPSKDERMKGIINVKNDLLAPIIRSEMHN